jgi:hypothetical protein
MLVEQRRDPMLRAISSQLYNNTASTDLKSTYEIKNGLLFQKKVPPTARLSLYHNI